ncbi:MAG: hypothetical protein PVH65_02975 [Chloroflexota bacterium]|jgi:hypothetical protein
MLRRLVYLIVIILFLVVMTLPIFAFVLAARGELMIGSDQGNYLRLFMVNTDQAEGIGLQRVRQSAASEGCQQGSVRYFLWEGQSRELNADYCTCFKADSGTETIPGQCPDPR